MFSCLKPYSFQYSAFLKFTVRQIRTFNTSSSKMSSSQIKQYDAIILGSGQGGTPLASALAKSGRKTALIEKSHIGGTCINEGCTPTKTMVASGRVAYLAHRAADYGIKVRVEGVSMEKVRQRKRDIVSTFRGGSENRLSGMENLDVLRGEGSFVGEKSLKVISEDGEVNLKADWVFISVGERPAVPKLEGLEEVMTTAPERVLNSTTIMELGEVPKDLIVLGGGYVGLEFAQLFQRLGAQVHIIQRAKQLLPREDPQVVSALHDLLKEEGLQIHLSTSASSISYASGAITLKTSDSQEIKGTHILLAAGRAPNTDTLNLTATGIKPDPKGYIPVNSYLETSVPGIYALGDCKGPPAFTHISYDDFRIVRDNLNLLPHPSSSTNDKPLNPHSADLRKPLVPYVCFTDPQLAHIGLHLSEIPPQERSKIKVASMPMSYVARGLETDEPRGIMKAVVEGDSGKILGFSCLAPEGGEIMSVVQAAMMGGVKWWEMREAVWAHPTWAESLNNIWGFLEDAPKE